MTKKGNYCLIFLRYCIPYGIVTMRYELRNYSSNINVALNMSNEFRFG